LFFDDGICIQFARDYLFEFGSHFLLKRSNNVFRVVLGGFKHAERLRLDGLRIRSHFGCLFGKVLLECGTQFLADIIHKHGELIVAGLD